MKKIKVLIIDDSAFIRHIFKEMLSVESDIEVLDTAVDPFDAREKIKRLNPDVITLDIEMPKMDGLSFLEKIMSLRPMPVIMVSTLTQKGAGETIRALELGAVDYISKPLGGENSDLFKGLGKELADKIRVAAKANLSAHNKAKESEPDVLKFSPLLNAKDIIAIGSSTGGVEALREIFVQLPENTPPIVITQHMPEHFTKSFANRLNTLSKVNVAEAFEGAKLEQGKAYIAPGGKHLKVVKIGKEHFCKIENGDTVSGHRPSVDVLFQSVAESIGKDAIGIILTGMGKDGAEGLLQMREKGAYTVGQNQASCVVYGMPKAAMNLNAVCKELPLSKIAEHVLDHCEHRGK